MSYLLRRLEFFAITLWAALTINFILPRLMPGNPAEAMMVRFHGRASPQAVKVMETALGLHTDQNILQQYLSYLGNTARGDLGTSVTFFPSSVGKVVMLALPWSIGLVGTDSSERHCRAERANSWLLGCRTGLPCWRRGSNGGHNFVARCTNCFQK